MKKSLLVLAALSSVMAVSHAAVTSESFKQDGPAWVYKFGANRITAVDAASPFVFTLNSSDAGFSSLAGKWNVEGDFSGTNFKVTGLKINGNDWGLGGANSANDLALGQLDFSSVSSVTITVTGNRLSAGSNFQGSLVLTPVPEPETYALMLAGLGAVGFVARRRKAA